MKSGIYKIQHIASGRLYIGSSVNVMARLQTHTRALNNGYHSNKLLLNSYKKHGKSALDHFSRKLKLKQFRENADDIGRAA